jgi:rSAM/selenodomain-associated transferase 2
MDRPIFSIIVPVFHEAENINDLIVHLRHLGPEEEREIIIVDGAPEKDTLRVISDNGVVKISSEKGRAKQMNSGASVAKGEVLIFLHADTELPQNALRKINAFTNKKEYVGGAFDLGIKSDKIIFKVIALGASLRSRLNRIPYGDQAIFIRKEYFDQIGGYKEILLMEDVELMRRIKRSGKKIKIFPDRTMTSPRRWEREGILYCTLRNYMNQLLYFLGVSPHKLVNWYKNDHDKVNPVRKPSTS